MDILFHLLGLLVRALLNPNEAKNAPVPRTQAAVQTPVRRSQLTPPHAMQRTPTSSPPLAPRTQTVVQNPMDEGEGWRLMLTLLAVIALIVLVAAWAMFMLGWL